MRNIATAQTPTSVRPKAVEEPPRRAPLPPLLSLCGDEAATANAGRRRNRGRANIARPATASEPPTSKVIAGESEPLERGGAPPPFGTSAAGEGSGLGVGDGVGVATAQLT